jgi:hypothetical protein
MMGPTQPQMKRRLVHPQWTPSGSMAGMQVSQITLADHRCGLAVSGKWNGTREFALHESSTTAPNASEED